MGLWTSHVAFGIPIMTLIVVDAVAADFWMSLFASALASKQHLHLHPHAADAAVREIAVQKAPCRRVDDTSLRYLHELRMIESVLSLPAKLQPPVLADGQRFEKTRVKIICSVRDPLQGAFAPSPGPMKMGAS